MDSSRHGTTEYAVENHNWACQLVSQYNDHLRGLEISASTVSERMATARHFVFWLSANELEIDAVDARTANRFLSHDCDCPVPYRYSGRCFKLRGSLLFPLLRFLESTGRTPIAAEIGTGVELIERFSQALLAQGYLPSTVRVYRGKCRHFIVWLYLRGIPVSVTDENVLRRFLEHDCSCARPIFFRKPGKFNANDGDRGRIGKFIDFLASEGVVEGKAQPPPQENPDRHLTGFLDWLRRHRGVAEQTLRNYRRFVSALLLDLGDEPGRYEAATIRDALLRRATSGSHAQARNLTVALRSYLRYLASAGLCPPGLVYAVPTIPERSHIRLPRYVSGEDIERSIALCDVTTLVGMRDRAILLLLARLALRAGEVANLRLGDIDWNEATIRVSGKSRVPATLPLPQDVGEALKDYILHARPRVTEDKVFLRSVAPRHVPVGGSGAVSSIARRALERAGVEGARPLAAHVFRHSAATGLLRSGAPLEAVSTLLRHRSPKTTAIYAKVDVRMLREVIQPWPIAGGPK